MIFLGMDHGTSAVRFAVLSGELVRFFEISREAAAQKTSEELLSVLEQELAMSFSNIDLACLTYSMGDGISAIQDIRRVKNRGVESLFGVGEQTGAGTKIFDLFAQGICPAILLPGLHQENAVTDSRMQHFSHQASPEKIGIAYYAASLGHRRFILSDIGSNTVTLAVSDDRILGALDAAVFAPGTRHGPLDVNALRRIDAGLQTANDAFSNAGVGDDKNRLAFFAAMEIAALDLLMKDYGADAYGILIAGSGSTDIAVLREISRLLQKPVDSLGKWSAAIGCAKIAQAVFSGEKSIFGISVESD